MTCSKLKIIAFCAAFAIIITAFPRAGEPSAQRNIVVLDQSEQADEVWSCDFNDGNLSEWRIYGFIGPPPYINPPGNFTAEDGVLRANGTEQIWSQAFTNSSVAYGTWNFDVDVVDTYAHEIVIPFIMVKWTLENLGIDCYFIQIVTGMYGDSSEPRLQAGKGYATDSSRGRAIEWYNDYLYEDILGWQHFTITREDDGQVYVYLNGKLAIRWKDNQHTTCNEFSFGTPPGPAIDNITVSDTVDYDAAPPEWEPEPKNQFIALGEDFRYDINASDFSGVDTWAVNDTTNFAIDADGVITDIVDLTVGTYGLNVSVSDTGGFTRSATFTVTVEDSGPPPIGVLPYLAVGGGAFLIVLVVVLIRNRR
ncbi:MAG: hypothetical protein ACFFEK_12790 [Candidatus Thorarchaeota archaeon]